MTENKVETELSAFVYETLSNDMLNGVMFENRQLTYSLSFMEIEQSSAQALVDTFNPHVVKIAENAVTNQYSLL
ncbi:MAG: hypothetical protein ACI35P_07530 [Bacillus sp. (in: firmicutes)]